jgi:hypothetical protein
MKRKKIQRRWSARSHQPHCHVEAEGQVHFHEGGQQRVGARLRALGAAVEGPGRLLRRLQPQPRDDRRAQRAPLAPLPSLLDPGSIRCILHMYWGGVGLHWRCIRGT